MLFETISYHDYAESFYHAFLVGLFANAGYIVESNYESGLGRPDLVIKDKKKRQAVIMEMKIADSLESMQEGRRKGFEAVRRDALCGWYVCSGVSKSDKVWSSILSKELSGRQM